MAADASDTQNLPVQAHAAGDAPVAASHRPQWISWQDLVFFVGIPATIAIYATLNNWRLLEELGLARTLLFYGGHTLPWYLTIGLTGIVMRILAPWRPGLLLIATLGSLLACVPAVPWAVWFTDTVAGGVGNLPVGGLHDPWGTTLYLLRATGIWVLVVVVFDRYLGYARFRYPDGPYVPALTTQSPADGPPASPAGAAGTAEPPAPSAGLQAPFLGRLARPVALADLVALKAEQHYIKVISQAGSQLVLHRLGDAVRELPADFGIQVHRSWWVSRRAITGVHGRGRKMVLELSDGSRVPVSTPYQALVRQTLPVTSRGATAA